MRKLSSSSVRKITATQVDDFTKCSLKFSFTEPTEPTELPKSMGAIQHTNRGDSYTSHQQVGKVLHLAIEMLIKDEALDVDDAWQLAFDRIIGDREAVSEVSVSRNKKRLKRRIQNLREFIDNRAANSNPEIHAEKSLDWNDTRCKLSGKLDLLIVDSVSTIIDHKKGSVVSDGVVEKKHRDQLAFYAHLVYENYDIDRVDCWLFSLKDGLVEVPLTCEDIVLFVEPLLANIEDYNNRVPDEQPAMPSDENCSWCPYCDRCEKFWIKIGSNGFNRLASGEAIAGTILGEISIAKNGKSTFRVDAIEGTKSGEVILTEVPRRVLSNNELSEGDSIKAFHLHGSEDNEILTWDDRNSRLSRN